MRRQRTQLRGRSRDEDASKRTSALTKKPGGTATGRAGWKAILITTIAVIVALASPVQPAAADTLVSNLSGISLPVTSADALSVNDIAQAFTTGTNVTGYGLESIWIDFNNGVSEPATARSGQRREKS